MNKLFADCPVTLAIHCRDNKNRNKMTPEQELRAAEPADLHDVIDECDATRTTERSFTKTIDVNIVTDVRAADIRKTTASVQVVRRFHTIRYKIEFAAAGIDHVKIDATHDRFDAPDPSDDDAAPYTAMAAEDRWAMALVESTVKTMHKLTFEFTDMFERLLVAEFSSNADESLVSVNLVGMNGRRMEVFPFAGFGDTYECALRSTLEQMARHIEIKNRRAGEPKREIVAAWTKLMQEKKDAKKKSASMSHFTDAVKEQIFAACSQTHEKDTGGF